MNLDDPVEILGAGPAPVMDRIRVGGRWLVPDVAPLGDAEVCVAVVDTGVVTDHPLLRDSVVEQVDLTGTGVEDRHGHGTSVAAILAATLPRAWIISVKALTDDVGSTVGRLCLGIREASRLLEGRGATINVSAGRRTAGCVGDCPLCTTTREVQARGMVVVAAAGNDAGTAYCPAREAIAVETPAPWDADGMVVAQPPRWVDHGP